MLRKEDYIKDANRKADQYVSGILSGEIVSNKWIKLAVIRYLNDLKREDLSLNQAKVDHVYSFFSLLRININNDYSQFSLLPYQAFAIKSLFLFYKGDRRKYRYGFIFVSRKSGKTVFAVGLELYFLIGDGVKDPECILLASTKEQATIALNYSKNICKNSPALKKVKRERYQLKFEHKKINGFMKPLASNAEHLDGYGPNGAILDEIHSYPDDSLFKVMKSGILARQNPMILLISTAGFRLDSFCNDMVESAKNVLMGVVDDDSFFYLLYTLDDGDDYRNPANWIKSNPSLGKTIRLDDMMIEYNQALIRPSEMFNFKTKNLNLFVETSDGWIDEEAMAEIYNKFGVDLRGRKCYAGMDLASTRDLVSFAFLFDVDGFFYAIMKYYLPKNVKKKLRRGGIDLSVWVNKGYIKESKTKTLDYDLVFQDLENFSKEHEVTSMGFDPFNSALIVPKIEELGINCLSFAQTAMNFNFPLKFMEKQIYDKTMSIGENPVLRWNFRNVVLYIDGNENIKIVKNKSLDSVDGVVSLAMAFGGWIEENIDPERRGLDLYLNK
jgi:phage terminase large subunit-like protein